MSDYPGLFTTFEKFEMTCAWVPKRDSNWLTAPIAPEKTALPEIPDTMLVGSTSLGLVEARVCPYSLLYRRGQERKTRVMTAVGYDIGTNGRSPKKRARDFLRVAHLFRLGRLPTERPHPETRKLSYWAQNDLPTAVSVLKSIDLRALSTLERYATEIDRLSARVEATLASGKRVFLCGCGATGRLSLSLEYLWREQFAGSDQVISFMAGGDVALVHSLEGFEDHPAYGARHLDELGFEDGDLLIACTEGGETPYVIGATERAATISSNPPFFLYCNTDSALVDEIARFRKVYDDPKINKICLYVGPMALAGSTRMQASTVLQLAVGVALLLPGRTARSLISGFRARVRETDLSFLADFIAKESNLYLSGHHAHYQVRDYGITVFTDTTERAPTFSLAPFEQLATRSQQHSLCYVSLAAADTPHAAWLRLLNREPRALNWPEVDPRTTSDYLRGFDFSSEALPRRQRQIPDKTHHEFSIHKTHDGFALRLGELSHNVIADDLPDLFQHLLLKQMLNIHSTLVMGCLGRFKNNLMTWVTPTNGKLVDRAARYVEILLAAEGRTNHGYSEIVRQLFVEMDRTDPGESVVLSTYRSLLQTGSARLSARRPAHRVAGQRN